MKAYTSGLFLTNSYHFNKPISTNLLPAMWLVAVTTPPERPVFFCMPSACGAEKRTLESQELELPKVVFYHVGAGNHIWVLCSSNK